jgi:hypothetical protein
LPLKKRLFDSPSFTIIKLDDAAAFLSKYQIYSLAQSWAPSAWIMVRVLEARFHPPSIG